MKKIKLLALALLIIFALTHFFKYHNTVVVYSCPAECEIGDLRGHIVEIKLLNELMIPFLFEEQKSFKGKELKQLTDIKEFLNLDASAGPGSWRIDCILVSYNRFGLIENIYIVGDDGFYFYSVNQISCICKKRLVLMDLIKAK